MNKDIMHLSNTLIYENYLKAANESIAKQRIKLSIETDGTSDFASEQKWVQEILSNCDGVTMVDIDKFNNWRSGSSEVQQLRDTKYRDESFKKRSITQNESLKKGPAKVSATKESQNDSFLLEDEGDVYVSEKPEEDMAIYLIAKYIKYGVSPSNITVITPYNSERCYLYSKLDVSLDLI